MSDTKHQQRRAILPRRKDGRVRFHGYSNHPAYKSWKAMIYRCFDDRTEGFENYGGRGITVSLRWMEVENFIKDMGAPPAPGYQIDRINNDGNYEPGNCRWVTPLENHKNTRASRILEYNGRRMIMCDWERELGFRVGTGGIRTRLKNGWSIEEALSTPCSRISK